MKKCCRLFWIVAFITAILFSGYFIDKIIDNYNNRVIISLNPYSTSANSVPFPTVTICNMNRVNKIKAQVLLKSGILKLVSVFFHNIFSITVSPTCEDMIKACFWKNKAVNCSVIFNDVITDVGACCVFNQLPLNYIFRQTYLIYFLFFSIQYTTTIRLFSGSGLTLVLDADIQNNYCSSSNSVGFKILISNPVEMSLVKNYGIHVPTMYQSVISLKPSVSDGKKSLQHESYMNRWCYFNQERFLKFFKTYTFRNCITECRVNYTLEKCNCIPYYMISNSTADMCEHHNLECIHKVQGNMCCRSKCHCLPNCNEYSFSERMSYNRLTATRLFYMVPANKIIENKTRTEFLKSAAIVKLYYEKSVIERSTKNDIYDIIEFLSNMGGLLCIFLGFSFLSGAEIAYHLLCAIVPFIIQMIRDNAKKKEVIPFMK
ncbi:hypothetical protein RN001_007478 [Aquatica leii]|uniref:Uncharacterized protein n=1 Tax=Aquatica leii TaxID=1421715 RepID=A0AAN7SFD8_9COLE|nr:hypothetical protein RN001_007478 [Aquatica leii]